MKFSYLSAVSVLLIASFASAQDSEPVISQPTPEAEAAPTIDSVSDTPKEKPAEEKPAEEKPAEEKPAEEKPAEEKPAEEKPAEEKPAEEKADNKLKSYAHYLNYLEIRGGLKLQGYSHSTLNNWTQDRTWVGTDVRVGASSALGKRVSLSYNASYFFADKAGSIRGSNHDLDNHNISLGLELGYLLNSRIQAYARVAPGASLMKIRVGSGAQTLGDNVWAFHSDQALGFRLRLLGKENGNIRAPRFWFFAEGGYALATSANVELSFDETELPNPSTVAIGKLQLNGANGSLGFGLSY